MVRGLGIVKEQIWSFYDFPSLDNHREGEINEMESSVIWETTFILGNGPSEISTTLIDGRAVFSNDWRVIRHDSNPSVVGLSSPKS